MGSYLSVSQEFGFDASTFVSYKACIFNAPPPPSRLSRQLLSIETAEFSNDDAEIKFLNPVFTFSASGTFIARKDGLEIVVPVKPESLQFVLPDDFRYSEGSLTFTFVTSSGTLISGAVHVPSSTYCSRINCIFCMAMITNFKCLPPTLQYIMYALLAFISGLTLIYLRAALRSLISIFYFIVWLFSGLYHSIKTCFRLSMRLGAVTGNSTRKQVAHSIKTISDFANK